MMKITLALGLAAVFASATPAFANDSADAAYSPEVSWQEGASAMPSFTRPIRRCFVRDRFRTYRNLRGCYINSPRPRTCRQICR